MLTFVFALCNIVSHRAHSGPETYLLVTGLGLGSLSVSNSVAKMFLITLMSPILT